MIMLAKGAQLKLADNDGMTPLSCAVMEGNTKVVEALLAKGAQVDLADEDGVTPLSIAALKGENEVVEALLAKGAQVDLADEDGVTPLFIAALNGKNEVVEVLLAKGAQVNLANKDGVTPLSCAVMEGNTKVVEALLAKGAQVDLTDECIAAGGKYGVAKSGIHGRRAQGGEDGGLSPTYSALKGKNEVVEALLAKGAQVDLADEGTVEPVPEHGGNASESPSDCSIVHAYEFFQTMKLKLKVEIIDTIVGGVFRLFFEIPAKKLGLHHAFYTIGDQLWMGCDWLHYFQHYFSTEVTVVDRAVEREVGGVEEVVTAVAGSGVAVRVVGELVEAEQVLGEEVVGAAMGVAVAMHSSSGAAAEQASAAVSGEVERGAVAVEGEERGGVLGVEALAVEEMEVEVKVSAVREVVVRVGADMEEVGSEAVSGSKEAEASTATLVVLPALLQYIQQFGDKFGDESSAHLNTEH
eukprot:gene5294-6436_t